MPANPKLRMPGLPPGVLTRPRLLDRLCASSERVVLVSGPAGFGKSVLVTEWLKHSRSRTAWLSLDELDNDPRRLLNHLAAALRTLQDESAGAAAAELNGLSAGADIIHDAALLDALEALDPAVVLVLDDVHLLESEASLGVLAALLDVRLPAPRVALLSRTNLPLPFGRLRVGGELLELREQDLRFTLEESVELFSALLPGGLDEELVQRLETRTEGWIAGLRMAALALAHALDRRAVVDAFTGSHRFVADYLLEEAVSRQPPDVQRFLMETSVLPRFTESACVAVMQDHAARELLHDVEAANLFLVPLGVDRQWFRYHHLFAELLQYRLRRLHPDRVEMLHDRASRWFEEQDDIAAAVEQAARMQSPRRLAELLDRHGFAFLARSEISSLKRWLKHVPDDTRSQYPLLLLCCGWIRVLTEHRPDLDPLFNAGARALSSGPPGYDEHATETARLEFEILRAFALRFSGRYEEALRTGATVIDELPPGSAALRGRILFNQARAYMMLGDMPRAAALLERSIADNLNSGTGYLVLTGLAQTAAVLLETDGVPRARQALDTAFRLAEDRNLTRLPAYSILLYITGYVHLVADELHDAESYFQRAVSMGSIGDMPEAHGNGLTGLARVRCAQRRFSEAERLLLDAEALSRTANMGLIEGDIDIPRRRQAVHLAMASGTPVQPQCHDHDASEQAWSVQAEGRDLCCILETLQVPDDEVRSQGRAAAERIIAQSDAGGRNIASCVARLGLALLGRLEDRDRLVEQALSGAAARGYIRPLLELGEPLRLLLAEAQVPQLSAQARQHRDLLLARLQSAVPLGVPEPAPGAAVPGATTFTPSPAEAGAWQRVGALTDREVAVLAHLCRGLSNKAIARAMFVSPETVKTHLKHIFDKLDVSRRRDAVQRARALGLVPAEQTSPTT